MCCAALLQALAEPEAVLHDHNGAVLSLPGTMWVAAQRYSTACLHSAAVCRQLVGWLQVHTHVQRQVGYTRFFDSTATPIAHLCLSVGSDCHGSLAVLPPAVADWLFVIMFMESCAASTVERKLCPQTGCSLYTVTEVVLPGSTF